MFVCPICGFKPKLQAAWVLDVHIKYEHVEANDVNGVNKAVDAGTLNERSDGSFTVEPIKPSK